MRPRPFFCAALIVVSGVCAGLFAGTSAATTKTPGDGCLVVQGGYGKVKITLSRGVVFGRFVSGQLWYSDLGLDKPQLPNVPGIIPTKTKEHVWWYGVAENVRFRAAGPTTLTVYAQQMDLSVAGKGTATISNAGFRFAPSTVLPPSNAYSIDAASFCEANFQKMPQLLTKVQISSPVGP